MNKFLKEFKDRGYFYQCTSEEELSKLLDKEKIKGYIGFDCTAESLHVGSLLQIMCLRLMQKHGHRPIVLIGGGTTRIGDPSGKDKTRKILTEEEIENEDDNTTLGRDRYRPQDPQSQGEVLQFARSSVSMGS